MGFFLGTGFFRSGFFWTGFVRTSFFRTGFGRDAKGRRGEELVLVMIARNGRKREKARAFGLRLYFLLYIFRIAFWVGQTGKDFEFILHSFAMS
jgi:hypothetical protein